MNNGNDGRGCGWIIAGLCNLPLSILLRGYILLAYWGWFAMPLGAPAIGFWHALGLSSMFAYFNIKNKDLQEDEKTKNEPFSKTVIRGLLTTVVVSLFFYGFGWFYHRMML